MVNKPNVNKTEWLLVEDITCLKEHIAQWQQLILETESNLFCSPEWIMTWIHTYWQPNWQLKMIMGFKDNKLIAIAPLYLQKTCNLFSLSTLMPLGQGEPENSEVLSEYQDIIIHPKENKLHTELAVQIKKISWDRVNWNALLETSNLVKILPYLKNTKCKESGKRYLHAKTDDYLSTLSKNNKSKWNKCKNKLSSLNAKFVWATEENFHKYWLKMIVLHQERWEKEGELGAFLTQDFINFHRHYQKNNMTKISALLVNEVPIAINYYLQADETLYFYQCGWNVNSYSNLSPGFALHIWSIIHNPFNHYDFMMGNTKDSYKKSFQCSNIDKMFEVTIDSNIIKSNIYKAINKFTQNK